jgi:hypothetical protein
MESLLCGAEYKGNALMCQRQVWEGRGRIAKGELLGVEIPCRHPQLTWPGMIPALSIHMSQSCNLPVYKSPYLKSYVLPTDGRNLIS